MQTYKIVPSFLLVLAVGLVLGCAGSGEQEKTSAVVAKSGYSAVAEADVTFQWRIADSRLHVVLSAPTKGWVAVGFNPTKGMQDANLIIGYVKDGEATVRDDYGTWLTSHESDEALGGTSDVLLVGGSESDQGTEISFSIPLDSGDDKDRALVAGQEYGIIVAFGNSDSFTAIHRKRGKMQVKL